MEKEKLQIVGENKTIPEPKVMLIDFPEDVKDRISQLGYNVTAGTFGSAFYAQPNQFVGLEHSVQLLHEQDIIFIDLEYPDLNKNVKPPALPDALSPDDMLFIVPKRQNYFNPRPVAALGSFQYKEILARGGIVVAFAARQRTERYILRTWGLESDSKTLNIDNYTWAPVSVVVENRLGTEVTFNDNDIFGHLARSVKQSVQYSAVFHSLNAEKDYTIARNSQGKTVGFARKIEDGYLIFLPRFEDFGPVIEMMLQETLVDLAPKLFPYSTRHTWLLKPEYEWPQIRCLREQREKIQQEYEKKLVELDQQMSDEREKWSFLHAILKTTGDSLVDNLIQVLQFIGFQDVRNVDQDKGQKEEDIQIWDDDQPILIEAKGLTGVPSEADCQQVFKYVARRQRELNRTDIRGVFIVNHQRHIPGLERSDAFTQQQIDDATHNEYALTTTWDIFRAILKVMDGSLEYTDIQAALTSKKGLVEYIPRNYREIGQINHYYPQPQAALVELFDDEELKIGDLIGFLSQDQRFEQSVESLEINREQVETVHSGIEFGLLVDQPVDKTFRLFKIEKTWLTNNPATCS